MSENIKNNETINVETTESTPKKQRTAKTATKAESAAPAKTAELTLEQKRELSLAKIANTRKVEGFYPEALLTKVSRDNTDGSDEVILLPAQVRRLWYRLWCEQNGVEGRLDVTVKELGTNMFRANAVVYINGVQVSEGEAFKMLLDPKYSPRETAQTQAINLALRNAGFEVYGEKMPEVVSSDDPVAEPKNPGLNLVVDDDGVVAEPNDENTAVADMPTPPKKMPEGNTQTSTSAAEPADAIPFVHSADEITEELANRALNVHWQVKSSNKTAHYNGMLLSAILKEEEGAKLIMWGAEKAKEDEYFEIARACRVIQILYALR